jgi:hypothetical protein
MIIHSPYTIEKHQELNPNNSLVPASRRSPAGLSANPGTAEKLRLGTLQEAHTGDFVAHLCNQRRTKPNVLDMRESV